MFVGQFSHTFVVHRAIIEKCKSKWNVCFEIEFKKCLLMMLQHNTGLSISSFFTLLVTQLFLKYFWRWLSLPLLSYKIHYISLTNWYDFFYLFVCVIVLYFSTNIVYFWAVMYIFIITMFYLLACCLAGCAERRKQLIKELKATLNSYACVVLIFCVTFQSY